MPQRIKSLVKDHSGNQFRGVLCSLCSLPLSSRDYTFSTEVDSDEIGNNFFGDTSTNGSNIHGGYTNTVNIKPQRSSILDERKNNASGAFIMHLNINSIQNLFEELKTLNNI